MHNKMKIPCDVVLTGGVYTLAGGFWPGGATAGEYTIYLPGGCTMPDLPVGLALAILVIVYQDSER